MVKLISCEDMMEELGDKHKAKMIYNTVASRDIYRIYKLLFRVPFSLSTIHELSGTFIPS